MSIQTMAGSLTGHTKHHIVRYDDQTGAITPIRVQGRWLYLKKCVKPEESGGILIPEKARDNTVVALVLAVGEECGKRENPKRARFAGMRGWLPQIEMPAEPMDRCVVPDDCEWGMIPSRYGRSNVMGNSEMFVHECLIISILE